MKFHTDTQFYTSALHVMTRDRYDALPPEVRMPWIRFAVKRGRQVRPLWTNWTTSVREGAKGPGHEGHRADAATWAVARRLKAGSERVSRRAFRERLSHARAAYEKMLTLLGR